MDELVGPGGWAYFDAARADRLLARLPAGRYASARQVLSSLARVPRG